MGLTIKGIIETDIGDVKDPYVVISNYNVSKLSAEMSYRITYFSNKEHWESFLPSKISELSIPKELPSDARFSPGSILYECKEELVEVSLPEFFRIKFAEKKVIEVPIIEEQEVIKKIPYVSFNKKGEEITKYREEVVIEEVEVGKEKIEEEIIDYDLFNNPLSFAYSHLKKELETLLVGVKIKNN